MAGIRAIVTGLLLSMAPSAVGASPPEEGATIAGSVRSADTAEPLAGAAVALPDLERSVATDAEGRYELRGIPPGPHHLTIRLVGYAPQTLHALVPADGRLEINVTLHSRPFRVAPLDVRAPVIMRGLENGDSARFPDREMSVASVRNHPLLEEPDLFQALESGDVVLAEEAPSGIHLRGGSSDETAYLLEGIPVFNPFHTAGISSAWNPDALSRLHVAISTPLPSFPHSLSGAIDGTMRAPGDHLRGQGGISTSQARVSLDGTLERRVGYLLSARSGFTGLIPRKNESSHLRGETGDVVGKLETRAGGGTARILGYDSENQVDAASTAGAENAPGPTPPRNAFEWHSRSVGAGWTRPFPGVAVSFLGWGATGDASSRWTAVSGRVRVDAGRRDRGLLAEVRRTPGSAATTVGLRVERIQTSYRVRSDSTGAPIWSLNARMPISTLYGQDERPISRRVALKLGGSVAVASKDAHADGWAQTRWSLSERLSLAGSYAGAHQFVQSLRNPESVVGSIFPADLAMVSNASGFPIARSRQGSIAADYRPGAGVHLSLQAYARDMDGLLLVAPRTGQPFAMGAFAVGSGTSRGVSVDWAWSGARYGFLASYGFQRVRYQYGDSSYVPSYAAKHLAEGGVIVFPTSTSSIRLGATGVWGRRTTTATGEFEWESCNLLDQGCEFGGSPHYEAGALGATPMPHYLRVDLGFRQHWHLRIRGSDMTIALFGSVTNLLERGNVLTYTRNPATGRIDTVSMRPRSPLVAGLEWQF